MVEEPAGGSKVEQELAVGVTQFSVYYFVLKQDYVNDLKVEIRWF